MRPALLVLALAALACPARAQELYRRPYAETYRLNYGYDHDGGGGGCTDYDCGGACYDGHEGSDLGAPFGTNVLAGADGVVSFAQEGCPSYGGLGDPCGSYCGNYVRIDHSDGTRTIYCHMELGSLTVRTGDRVACGQLIGHSASSGSSTGPHLHFGYRPTTSSAYRDAFVGACSSGASRWVMQRAYREAPSDMCSCVAAAETCNGRDDDCDGTTDEDDVCEIVLLQQEPGAYAPPSSTDVDGNGRADVCARDGDGIHCWLAGAGGWTAAPGVVPFSDAGGWGDPANWSTLRMGDLDGDGRADLCGRGDDGVYCALSTGSDLRAYTQWQAGPSDANGWGAPSVYTTIRLADVDADGRDDLCGRDAEGFGCWLSDGTRFDRRIEGPRWSDASGWAAARFYGSIRMGDLDADGRADVCARSSAGVECWLADGDGFPTPFAGPPWSDDRGWGAARFWSTLRLADVDGDRRADLCARNSFDLRCMISTGTAFDRAIVIAGLADTSGWGDPTNYATIRVGDIDGDGADDVCARANDLVICWAVHGETVVQIDGPAWSDAAGWGAPQYYETMRLADFDGDGDDDLCGRGGTGWSCAGSTGTGFDAGSALDAMRDDQGWGDPRFYSTILSGGRARACVGVELESCNGVDDDCDGRIDEDGACPRGDGAVIPRTDGGTGTHEVSGSCGCSAPGRTGGGGWIALVLLGAIAALIGLRHSCRVRRRRSAALAALFAVSLAAGCESPTDRGDRDGSVEPIDAAEPGEDAAIVPMDAPIAPTCRGATQPCQNDDACCGDLTCGSTMLGDVCCSDPGGTCSSAADCCDNIPCTDGHCMAMCHVAREACSGSECCSGLTCGTTSLGTTCCGMQLTPCSTSDGSDCCGALLCGTTTAGQVCCGSSGASCSTSDGSDCCGALNCVSGRCQ